MNLPPPNAEHYSDTTADHAIWYVDKQQKKADDKKKALSILHEFQRSDDLKNIMKPLWKQLDPLGYDLLLQVAIQDKKTKKVYK